MREKKSVYTDFLKDKKFIQWQLLPDEKSERYWSDFFQRHPQLVEESHRAISYLKETGLNKSELSSFDKDLLLEKVQQSIKRKQKKRTFIRIVQYAAVASVVVFFAITGLNIEINNKPRGDTGELIIGNLFEAEEIQLFAENKAIALQDNAKLKINEDGNAEVVQNNTQASKSLDIAQSEMNKLVIPYGKRMQLALSDGSVVWLNSGSVLEFPTQFSGNKREIYLNSGEIYVEVVPDKKKSFYVHTTNFDVKVHGTKFNLSSYSNLPTSVVLVEGLVSLKSENVKEQFLSPSEKAVYADNSAFSVTKVDTEKYTSWKDGYLVFDKTPMTEVLSQIERYYNLSFNYYRDINLQKRTCTGKIYLSDDLDNVMITIGLLTSAKYKREKNQIYIINDSD